MTKKPKSKLLITDNKLRKVLTINFLVKILRGSENLLDVQRNAVPLAQFATIHSQRNSVPLHIQQHTT